jgi:hypothetical protein
MGNEFPCNCYHFREDHMDKELNHLTYCRYSEYGQCPCDYYTPMTNLEFLEFKYGQSTTL